MSSLPSSSSSMHAFPGDIPFPGTSERRAPVLRFRPRPVAFSELVAALTYALDLASSESSGHTLRACLLGMNLGRRIFLAPEHMSELYYALLLKDVGTTSNAVAVCELMGMDEPICRYAMRVFDWTHLGPAQISFVFRNAFSDKPFRQRTKHVFSLLHNRKLVWRIARQRAITSELIARKFGRPEATIDGIRSVDEHWDGSGGPAGLRTDDIPLISQICSIAQTLESLDTIAGRDAAVKAIERRSGKWFDPGLVAAVVTLHEAGSLWDGVDSGNLMHAVLSRDPHPEKVACGEDAFENICSAFADMIDAKSHYTYKHSQNVATLTEAIGVELGMDEEEITTARRAALLHDIGMMGISNPILDKGGPLTQAQWSAIREHPHHSYELLRKVRGFDEIARIARDHHERLDGSGYPAGLTGTEIDLPTRIVSVADVYDAVCSPRAYRDTLAPEKALQILDTLTPHALDAHCVDALKRVLARMEVCRQQP